MIRTCTRTVRKIQVRQDQSTSMKTPHLSRISSAELLHFRNSEILGGFHWMVRRAVGNTFVVAGYVRWEVFYESE